MAPGSSKPTVRSETVGPARQRSVGARERILQEIDWEFLVDLNQEEALLLFLSLLERPGLSDETRQILREAMGQGDIPVPAALSGRARPVLLRVLRHGSLREFEDLEILCRRLREKQPWNAEDVFDLLDALPFELAPHRACRVARVLPLLFRIDRGRSLTLWRRLISQSSEGVRLLCLPILLRQAEMEDDFILDLVSHAVAEADVLFRIELAASMPLDAKCSQPAIELLAAQWTGQRQYEPLVSLFERLAAGPVELLRVAFQAALGCGLLTKAPTLASVRELYTIPGYDLPALEEALEIEGGCHLQVLACLFKAAADPEAGLLQQMVAEELMSARVDGRDAWASCLRAPEVQPHLSALIEAWGSRNPGGARQLVLRLLEVQAFETDPGEALAFRFEKALCRAALELPKETLLLLEFLTDPPDWLTGLVGRELAIERVRGVAGPFPIEVLREMALGIGAAMQAGPEAPAWSLAMDLLLELAGRVWRDLSDAYVEAETADESERLVRRIDLVAWCGSLPGSFFALLAHIGLRPGCTTVAVIGARLTLAVARLASCEGTRWPSLPYPLSLELASFLCQQLAKGLRSRPWPEVCPALAYLGVGIEKSRPARGGGVLVG